MSSRTKGIRRYEGEDYSSAITKRVAESQPIRSGDGSSNDDGSDDDEDFELSPDSQKKQRVKKRKSHTKQRKGGESSEDSSSEDDKKVRNKVKNVKNPRPQRT